MDIKAYKKIVNRRMPFGQYKGQKISSLPIDYLQWLESQSLPIPIREAVLLVLGKGYTPQPKQPYNVDDYVAGKILDRQFRRITG